MPDSNFPGNLKPLGELESNQKELLIEHYRRCGAFWRHWTTTIWSIPSIVAVINVAAYSLIFDTSRSLDTHIKTIVLGVLVFLNLTVTLGVWKHRYLQRVFGERILDLEKYASIPTIEFGGVQRKISASKFYVMLMVGISIVSLVLLIKSVGIS